MDLTAVYRANEEDVEGIEVGSRRLSCGWLPWRGSEQFRPSDWRLFSVLYCQFLQWRIPEPVDRRARTVIASSAKV